MIVYSWKGLTQITAEYGTFGWELFHYLELGDGMRRFAASLSGFTQGQAVALVPAATEKTW